MKIDTFNYKKYLQALRVQLLCINNQFDHPISLKDLVSVNINLVKIYDSLANLQMFLVENKEVLAKEDLTEQQRTLNSTFKYLELLERKFKNAKHIMMNLFKDGRFTSEKDTILFTTDDDLLQN